MEDTDMNRIHRAAVAVLLGVCLAVPAAAQTTVTQADIQRLQDNVYLAERDVTSLRGSDSTRATQLQSEIDDLRDEVVYLKVKLRKERSLARAEYSDVRDRIEGVRTRARGESTNAGGGFAFPSSRDSQGATPAQPAAGSRSSANTNTSARGMVEVPTGTELDVRLSNSLNSGTANVEDRFEATTLVDQTVDGRVAIPAGSVVRGVVTAVERGTRTNRTSRMTVSFDQVTVGTRSYPMRGTVTEAIEGEGIRGEAGRAGVGAGVGAVIGGLLGGVKGAIAGVLIGGGGTIAATEGKEVDLPQGSVLRVRLDSPLPVQPTGR
jgi:hypothetical protein